MEYLTSNSFHSKFKNTIARIRHSIAMALKTIVTPLPKMIVIVLEDDLIYELKDRSEQLTFAYGRQIEWLLHEIRKLISAHNDALPKKAKRKVNIIWILPAEHVAFSQLNAANRQLLRLCIKRVTAQFDANHALELRQMWDKTDASLYLRLEKRFTPAGLTRLWKSVDRAIWFADTLIYKANEKETRRFHTWENSGIVQGMTYRPPSHTYRRKPFNRFQSRGSRRPKFGPLSNAERGKYFEQSYGGGLDVEERELPPPPLQIDEESVMNFSLKS